MLGLWRLYVEEIDIGAKYMQNDLDFNKLYFYYIKCSTVESGF